MFHSWSFLSLLAVAATVAFIGVAGCGSSDKTCADARIPSLPAEPSSGSHPAHCSVRLRNRGCVHRQVHERGCPKVQQLVDCSAAVQCNNLAQVKTDVTACFTAASVHPDQD